jgi:hypothetical protein
MKLAPAGLGAEPKKVALLAGILVLGVVVIWLENRSDTPVAATVTAPVAAPAPIQPLPEKDTPAATQTEAAPAAGATATAPVVQRRAPLGMDSGNDSFVPSLKKNDDLDGSKIDPRIRLDLLAKVRAVPLEGGASSLFEFSKSPEELVAKVDPIKPGPVPVPPPVVKSTAPAKPPGPPPAPPIPFKYYGYSGKAADGQLEEGFFLEGDPTSGSIYLQREGDIVKDRYKIVRIGLRSAVVEDTVTHNEQTLKLPEDQQ